MDNVKEYLIRVIGEHGLDRMPTSKEMRAINGSLASRIERTGGYIYWGNSLGLRQKRVVSKWNDNRIRSELVEVIDELDLGGYAPTLSQINMVKGGSSLTSAISRSGGLIRWKEELGLKSGNSTYERGLEFEKQQTRHWLIWVIRQR